MISLFGALRVKDSVEQDKPSYIRADRSRSALSTVLSLTSVDQIPSNAT